MSLPIAARLKELVELELRHQQYLLPTHAKDARDQLRALFDIAAAAEEVKPECCWGYSLKTKKCRCRSHRALALLRDLAQGKRRPARRSR